MRVTMKCFIIAKSPLAAAFLQGECHCAAGPISIQSRPSGEVSEWLKEHAWKVCIRKRIEGSNPSFSATYIIDLQCFFFIILQLIPARLGNGARHCSRTPRTQTRPLQKLFQANRVEATAHFQGQLRDGVEGRKPAWTRCMVLIAQFPRNLYPQVRNFHPAKPHHGKASQQFQGRRNRC